MLDAIWWKVFIIIAVLILLLVLMKKYVFIPPSVEIIYKSCVKYGEPFSLVGNIKSTFSPITLIKWKTPGNKHHQVILNNATLKIGSSKFEDSGYYQMTVSNWFGSELRRVQVTVVADKPVIRCEKKECKVSYGESANLKVSIDSRPPILRRQWYTEKISQWRAIRNPLDFLRFDSERQEKKYTESTTKYDDILTIKNCCVLDEGIYYFEASNAVGFSESTRLKLWVVNAPPHVSIQVQRTPTQFERFQIDGTIISNLAVESISWQKTYDGVFEDIDILDKRCQGSNLHPKQPALIVKNVTVEDDATYRLSVRNAAGKTTSNEYRFQVERAHPLLTISGDHEVQYGQNTELQLRIRSNKPIKAIKWFKIIDKHRGKVLQEWKNQNDSPEIKTFPCKTVQVEGCSLELKEVSLKDQGGYQVHVATFDQEAKSDIFLLQILNAPPHVRINFRPCFAQIEWFRIAGTIISNLAVESISWQKNFNGVFEDIDLLDKRYQGSNLHSKQPQLIVKKVTAEDDAIYRLSVRNAAGKATSNEYRFHAERAHPLLTISGDHEVQYGQNTELQLCIRSNKPIKAIKWFKNIDEHEKEVLREWKNQKDSPKVKTFPCKTVQVEGCSLELKEVSLKDQAGYQVQVVTFDEKSESDIFLLQVLNAPPLVKLSAGRKRGSIVATITSNEAITSVIWQKMYDGSFQDIDITHRKYSGSPTDTKNPRLEIQNLTAEDDTLYRLIVKSTAGECISDDVHLVLKSVVPILAIDGPNQVESGNDATLTLAIRSNKLIQQIKWIKIHEHDGSEVKIWGNQNQEINSESTFPCKTILESGCYLELKEVSMKDDAEYQAIVQTVDGKTQSEKFKLMILKAAAEIILPEEREVCYDMKATIPVTFRTRSPIQCIVWMKAFRDNYITINTLCDKYYGSNYDSSGAVFVVHHCDVCDDARYRITVYNGYGQSQRSDVHLRVLDAPPIVKLCIPETPCLHDNAKILARIQANRPLNKITWYKYLHGICKTTENISRDPQTYYNTMEESEEDLIMWKVNTADQGFYHVEVSHSVGNAQSNTVGFVVKNAPPVIAGITGPTQLGNRDTECTVHFLSAQPIKSIKWKHLEREIHPLDGMYELSTDNSTYSKLTVKEECYDASSQYVCEVANPAGTTKSDTIHISYETYLQIKIEEPTKNFKTGETAVLIANMKEAPGTTKIWSKTSKSKISEVELSLSSDKYHGSTSEDKMSALCINNLNSDDEGYYQLTVTKRSGQNGRSKKVWLGIDPVLKSGDVEKEKEKRLSECQICFDEETQIVLIPCGHTYCESCASSVRTCPLCRKLIERRVKFYK